MRFRLLPFACITLLLAGLAGTLYKVHFPPGPVADEAAYVLMAGSLWEDHDLNYDHRDLARAYQTWDQGPYGLILFTRDGGETTFFGKPYVYSALAVPFYALFGAQGLVVFNMLLYLAMFATAWWLFSRPLERLTAAGPRPGGPFLGSGSALGGLFLGGFFFASVAFVYVFWMQPEVFNMACTFFPLAIWAVVRGRQRWGRLEHLGLTVAGFLLAAACVSKEPLAAMALPIVADLAWSRRWRGLSTFVAAGIVGLFLLVGVQYKLTGAVSPYRDVQRRSFESNYPLEMQGDPWDLYKGTSFGSWSAMGVEATPRAFGYSAFYFVFGRHTGLLPYFPFALFVLALFACGPRDRLGWLVLGGVGVYVLFFLLVRPWNYHGGAGFLGNRYFAGIYPALLFLLSRFEARKSLLLPFAAAGLWTASVVAVPIQQIAPEATLQSHVRSVPFQALPLELTLLGSGKLPGYWQRNWGQGTWILRKDNWFAQENHPNGLWVRGSSDSEVIVVSPVPLDSVYFTAWSPLPDNVATFESGAERVVVRFDTAGKRDGGVPVELAIEPIARDLGFLATPREYFYRFTVETEDGWMPARREEGSGDYRYLSVFLSFTGEPP
jgi:hypothetical protein